MKSRAGQWTRPGASRMLQPFFRSAARGQGAQTLCSVEIRPMTLTFIFLKCNFVLFFSPHRLLLPFEKPPPLDSYYLRAAGSRLWKVRPVLSARAEPLIIFPAHAFVLNNCLRGKTRQRGKHFPPFCIYSPLKQCVLRRVSKIKSYKGPFKIFSHLKRSGEEINMVFCFLTNASNLFRDSLPNFGYGDWHPGRSCPLGTHLGSARLDAISLALPGMKLSKVFLLLFFNDGAASPAQSSLCLCIIVGLTRRGCPRLCEITPCSVLG